MKTAVSLPDRVFHQADRIAKRLGKTRSALYRDALTEYLARHSTGSITERMNRVIASEGQPESISIAASARILKKVEW